MRYCTLLPVLTVLMLALMCRTAWTWGSDKVLLKDITALTLYQGHMTTGRRSSPVQQLKCVGGSAGCYKFSPQTVQCRNVGFDGRDVQWECKCDMDDSYRFGKVQVTCEGYDYPDDPYILKGSCGLEYTIDYTGAGQAKNNYYATSWSADDSSGGGGWIFFFIVVFVIVFMICKMSGSHHENGTPYPDPRRSDHGTDHHRSGHNNPPTYGFKSEYTHPQPPPPSYSDATQDHRHTSSYTRSDYRSHSANSPYGGFWSGLGLGTIGGYLFGSRRRGHNYGNPGYGWGNNGGWGSSWGSNGGWGSSWGSGGGWGSGRSTYRRSTGSGSSGTSRTTSGFGGTTRR